MPESLSNQSSQVRIVTLSIFNKIDNIAIKYITHNSIKWFYSNVVKPRLTSLLSEKIPESELKQILVECYDEVKPIVEKLSIAEELKESDNLNDKKMNDSVKKILKVDDLVELFE